MGRSVNFCIVSLTRLGKDCDRSMDVLRPSTLSFL